MPVKSGKKAVLWVMEWGILWGFWMLCVSKWSPAEAFVGGIAAAVAATATRVVQKEPLAYFSPYFRWVAQARFIPRYILSGTWEALKALSLQVFTKKGCPSLLQYVPFDAGSDDPASQARRALAVIYTTCTPNFVVLGIDYERGQSDGLFIYHQILKTPVLKITRSLGAKA